MGPKSYSAMARVIQHHFLYKVDWLDFEIGETNETGLWNW